MKTSRRILRRVNTIGRLLSRHLRRVYKFVSGLFDTRHQEVSKQAPPIPAHLSSPAPGPESPASQPAEEPIEDSRCSVPKQLTLDSIPCAAELSENMRELIECRLEDIRESEGYAIEHAGLIVDFLDEIMLLLPNAELSDANVLARLQDKLKDTLKQAGGELLFFTVWTPEYQRAVEVERCLPKDSPSILQTHKAYGFKLNGKLIRKQEVSIQAPIL